MPLKEVADLLITYERLIEPLGLSLDRAALRRHTAKAAGYRGPTKTVFSEAHAAKHPTHSAPACIKAALDELTDGATKLIRSKLNGALPKSKRPITPAVVSAALAKVAQEDRQAIACALLDSEHGKFVRRPEIPIEEFRKLLSQYAQGQTLARKALIEHLGRELHKRGIDMSFDTIEERFRSNTTVKTMPACVVEIIQGLDDSFRTGLVPIEHICGDTDPREWLEERRQRYFFKSASAMHQAIAAATGLRYDSVHKALGSRKPAKRIQRDVVECFNTWEKRFQGGEDLEIPEEYQGVPIARVRIMIARLRERYGSTKKVKALLASELGVSASWVQRYMAASPRVKHIPMEYYGRIVKLAEGPLKHTGESYLKDDQTRELAQTICERANKALAKAQKSGSAEDKALDHYKKLRLRLIEVLKQRRTAPDSSKVEADD